MNTGRVNMSLLYAGRAPVRWVCAAVAAMDQSLAKLCARQWHAAQLVRAEIPCRQYDGRGRCGT